MPVEQIPYITLATIAAAGYVSYLGFSRSGFMDRYIFDPYYILARREYHRMLTSGFLHADWLHFGINAYSFYSFGSGIEWQYGAFFLMVIFFCSVLGGSLLSLLLHRHHSYRALGASGGVCGVIYASIFLFPGSTVRLFLIPVDIPAYVFAIFFVLFSVFGMRAKLGNIGHDAHLGGALVGLGIATLWYPVIISEQPVLYTLVVLISLGAFIYFYFQTSSSLPKWPSLSRLFKKNRQARQAREDYKLDNEVDRILTKVSEHGMPSLTDREINILKRASQNQKSVNE